ncbi:hypothetical protein ACO0K0_12815 [Undibacterium sp. SXout11W]|uniref:hypothetical protein n=1 Tax=Undibacterium sp. SXout11W TaxID=3413050 RepID=UPI003BF33D1E
MKRRQFIFAGSAGAISLLGSSASQASNVGQAMTDAVLRLNPAIQPEERDEKRIYTAINTPDALWQTNVCGVTVPTMPNEPKQQTAVRAYLSQLATQNRVPVLFDPAVRRDVQATSKQGFYLYFNTLYLFLRLSDIRPKNLISYTGKYMDCGSREEYMSGPIPRNAMSIDYRKFALIQGDKVSYPTHKLEIPRTTDGGILPGQAYLKSLTEADVWPATDRKMSKSSIDQTLYYDLPLRPIRFRLELPPMIIQGIEVPLPTCFFEPFDHLNNKFVDS